MKYQPRKPPEGINSSQDSPLTDALYLILYTTLGLCVLYLGLSFLSQQVVAQISLQQEVDFFRSSKQEENASPLEQKMQKLTNQLWSHYDEAKNIQIETRIKKSDQLNAFMKMGGRMELTQGLVHKLENENGSSLNSLYTTGCKN